MAEQQQQQQQNAAATSSTANPLQTTTLTDLQSELTTLNRVSHRLAMTDAGPALEKVLNVLLPRLLSRIGKNEDAKKVHKQKQKQQQQQQQYHVAAGGSNKRKAPSSPALTGSGSSGVSTTTTADATAATMTTGDAIVLHGQITMMHDTIHKKLIEMLTHTMKRVREDRSCQLPCGAILELLQPQPQQQQQQQQGGNSGGQSHTNNGAPPSIITANPFTINLSLAFLTLGMNRCTPVECSHLLPGLLTFLSCLLTDDDDDGQSTTNSTTNIISDSASSCRTTSGNKEAALFNSTSVGVKHILDPSRKMRHDQTWHLILRCLEYISHNPMEHAAARRAASGTSISNDVVSNASASSSSSSDINNASATTTSSSVPFLNETKKIMTSNPIIGAALFDLIADIFLYTPVPATSTLIPNGLSSSGYQRLVKGAASEKSGGGSCKSWKEEFASRANLRELKLKLLDLIAPCRRFALFLTDGGGGGSGSSSDGNGVLNGDTKSGMGEKSIQSLEENTSAVVEVVDQNVSSNEKSSASSILEAAMGISRTVALMTLLTGDSDPDVKKKAESYLRAHMDTYRGKEIPTASSNGSTGITNNNENGLKETTSVHDVLLGNSVALAQSILTFAIGDVASMAFGNKLMSQYKTGGAKNVLQTRLGLTFRIDKSLDAEQKALLSCSRMKVSGVTAAPALKFVAKMLEDNPKLFHIGMDMGNDESDIAAVTIGSLTIAAFGDLRQPGSSGSLAVEAVASLLNALCLRLSLFYDARAQFGSNLGASLERIRLLLAKSMAQSCAVLAPISSGQSSSSVGNAGSKSANTQIDIRDQCYGVVCTLARSRFCLDDRYALFDCGNSSVSAGSSSPSPSASSYPLSSISTAALLFGCVSNEIEMLRPRATSALDALLGAYVRVIKFLAEEKKILEEKRKNESNDSSIIAANPWADVSSIEPTPVATSKESGIHAKNTDGLSRSMLPLLWTASRRTQPKSSRLAAARWAHELLLRLDNSSAYHLLCFLSGDDDATVSMISKRALGVESLMGEDINFNPEQMPSNSDSSGSFEASNDCVNFSSLMNTVVGTNTSSSLLSRPKYAEFPVLAKTATLRFFLQTLFSEDSFYGDETGSSALQEFVLTILRTLAIYKGRSLTRDEADLLDECSICLEGCVSASGETRSFLIKNFKNELLSSELSYGFDDIAKQALTSNSSKGRRHLSQVMGSLYEDKLIWADTDDSSAKLSVSDWLKKCGLAKNAKECNEKLQKAFESSYVVGEVHGAAFLGSSCVRAFRLAVGDDLELENDIWEICSGIVSLLGKGLSHTDEAIGNACSRGLVVSFSYDNKDAPILNPRLHDAVAFALNEMNSALRKFNSIDHVDPTRVSTLIRAAGLLLAASTSGAGSRSNDEKVSIDLGPARLQCTEALFAILGGPAYRKDDELSLTVGEALVSYADAFGSGEWSSDSDLEWPEGAYDEAFAHGLSPHRHVLYTLFRREILSTSPMKRNACAATFFALVGHASRMVNIDHSFANRSMIKEVSEKLRSFQSIFVKLLSDPKSKQLSRESYCKGLAACRGLAEAVVADAQCESGDSLNERLLKAFGQTAYGGSAMMETRTQAMERRNDDNRNSEGDSQEIEVGGAAGLGEAALGAYREMAAAALSLGRPDVVYSLMILSTNHPVWLTSDAQDRYSAKSLLGKAEGANNVNDIRSALRPHLGKLIPRLLRACNDPNKHTRENMNSLWVALTGGGAESRTVITENLLPTIDVLMQDAVSKSWRARVGACGALGDVIVGRSWDDLGGGAVELDDEDIGVVRTASIRLLRMWKITMRALDDVRTPVREKGEVLGRALRGLTMRLCDPSAYNVPQDDDVYLSNAQRLQREKENEITAEYAATVSLGWLVKYGLNQPCAEATGICISCLLGIVDVSKPPTLQPVLPELCYALLMAMSGLEPAALNYLQVRAAGDDISGGNGTDRYDRLERLRIQLAMSGPIASALNKCLDMVKFVELDAQKKLIPELDSSLRQGAGFATRAAAADAVTSLCNSCPSAFKFHGSSSANPTVRLLRALYFASERERGITAKDKMTHALGSLAELAPGKAVRQLAIKACDRYCESSGSNNDPSTRRAAAATIRAIAVRSSNQFHDGGPKDIWRKKVLPIAFLGMHDEDSKVASLWKDVWDEGGSVISSVERIEDTFGVMLHEKLLPFLVSAILSALRDMSWARRRSACAALMELANANILAPTPRSTSSNDDSSLQSIDDRFRQRAQASSVLLSECVHIITRSRLWTGKGEVIKSGTLIAGKWSGVSPVNRKSIGSSQNCEPNEWIPLVLKDDSPDDLFEGDGWFSVVKENIDISNDDDGKRISESEDKVDELTEQNTENDAALDFSEENGYGEEELEEIDRCVEIEHRRPAVTFFGLCRILLDQGLSASESTEGVLPYKAAALSSLSSLLQSIVPSKDSKVYGDIICHQRFVYNQLAPRLFSFASEALSKTEKSSPPLLTAKSLECLASAVYDGIGICSLPNGQDAAYDDALKLLKLFSLLTGNSAWTVRQMTVLAASSLVTKMTPVALRRNDVVTTALDCSGVALKDRKFWKVRHAGLELILSLVSRVGNQKVSDADSESQLIMEAILPYKEKIHSLARASLSDNEAQVTATASKITLSISWWP